jgi:hypothetical protein
MLPRLQQQSMTLCKGGLTLIPNELNNAKVCLLPLSFLFYHLSFALHICDSEDHILSSHIIQFLFT